MYKIEITNFGTWGANLLEYSEEFAGSPTWSIIGILKADGYPALLKLISAEGWLDKLNKNNYDG